MNSTKQRLQQLAGIIPLNEITIKTNTLSVDWVKANFEKIYTSIESIDSELHDNTSLTLNNVDEIDYSETLIDIEGYGLNPGDLSRIPKDFITIHIPSSEGDCDGIYISNYGQDIQNLLGSGGYSWKPLPNSKYFYSYMWC